MTKTWLLIDSNNICWQSFYAMGRLSWKESPISQESPTEALYGLLRRLLSLQARYTTRRVAFCFDVGESVRKARCETYKANRKKLAESLSDEDKEERQGLYDQINLLREEYLPYIGYRNVFGIERYEADDIIAHLCLSTSYQIVKPDKAVIVSNDKDLLQCLRDNVSIDKNDTNYTKTNFMAKWRFHPKKWAEVKAISGCSTDNIPGVPGVGELTAAKYIRGILPKHHKTYKAIQECEEIIRLNRQVVELPYKYFRPTDLLHTLKLRSDKLNKKRWRKLMRKLGMRSLVQSYPRGM